jgi:hypothetical protein
MVADRIVSVVASNTIGRVARFLGKRVLGEFPEEAVSGSFQPVEGSAEKTLEELEGGQRLLEEEVASQLSEDLVVDEEDEALFEQIFQDNAAGVNGTVVDEKPAVGV